jgi:hypothetical protein
MRPTDIQDEDEILNKLQGRAKMMTIRDFSIYRIFLACIFNDLHCMQKMLERLEGCPLFDLSLVRQNLRFTYCGIAAFVLARSGRDTEKYTKIGREIYAEVKKLNYAKRGSKELGCVNVRPIMLCLKAVERNKEADYDRAIACCEKFSLLQLKALMNELAGMTCLEQCKNPYSGNDEHKRRAEAYLEKALWAYQDWGAMAKVNMIRSRFDFLSNLTRRAAHGRVTSPRGAGAGPASVGSIYSHESRETRASRFTTYFSETNCGRQSTFSTSSEIEPSTN